MYTGCSVTLARSVIVTSMNKSENMKMDRIKHGYIYSYSIYIAKLYPCL